MKIILLAVAVILYESWEKTNRPVSAVANSTSRDVAAQSLPSDQSPYFGVGDVASGTGGSGSSSGASGGASSTGSTGGGSSSATGVSSGEQSTGLYFPHGAYKEMTY